MKIFLRFVFPVLLVAIFVFAFFQKGVTPPSYQGKEVSAILETMPKKDRERLEYFFWELFYLDAFGFVLLGDKPMSLGSTERTFSRQEGALEKLTYALSPRRLRYQKGYETWRKYEDLFPISRFCFLYEEQPSGETWFLLVNKKSFVQKVAQHSGDFARILQRKISGEELLEEGKNHPMIREVLMNHDGLFGTLLGYGRDNSHLFHEAFQTMSLEEFEKFCDQRKFDLPFESEFNAIFEKRNRSANWITTYITGSQSKDLDLIFPPAFRALPDDPETLALREAYLQTKKRIIEHYRDKDFLETTLKILISEG
jgi:hypothetical protein